MIRFPLRVGLWSLLVGTAGFGAVEPQGLRAQSYESVLAEYRAYLQRPSLFKRTLGRFKLAQTKDPRALDVLMRSYAKPEQPVAVNRHLIASIAMGSFGASADQEVLAQWRKKHGKTDDSWLWFETLKPSASKRFDLVRDILLDVKDPFLRAAALESLAQRIEDTDSPDGLPRFCELMLDDLPKKGVPRSLQIEAIARVILSMKSKLRSEPWKSVCSKLIDQLDEKDTPQRTKVVIARYLTAAFGVPNQGLVARWWRSELERTPSQPTRSGDTTTVPFFSVRTIGYRFVYVIDASDSMLERVTDREKKRLGPTTGKRPKKGEEKEEGFVPDADDIDWGRVITRFDAAREYLRLSLKSLNDEHQFAVILFGDEAQLLKSTPRMIKGSRGNVSRVLAELEKIEIGSPKPDRPNGTLLGRTNLFGGIAAAFNVSTKGSVKGDSYSNKKAMETGCDTIFLLSDGAPSWDDYAERDSKDPEDRAGDPETGAAQTATPMLNFWGPFGYPDGRFITQQLRRLNLFRRAEIHCVGIGEANQRLLESLAEIGQGQAVMVEGEGR